VQLKKTNGEPRLAYSQ